MLRCEFETEGAGVLLDSQCLKHQGSKKPRFLYCLDSIEILMKICAIQGYSRGTLVDPELLNYVVIPLGWKEYLYHVGGSFTMHSITQAGLIAAGKDTKESRQTVRFTALDPWSDELDEKYEDLTKPRMQVRVTPDALYWINLKKSAR